VHFLTYEVFADQTAFKAHLESAHMAEFRAAVKELVVGRRVEGYQLVSRGPVGINEISAATNLCSF
jgi:quinol monooxygenase YgiN